MSTNVLDTLLFEIDETERIQRAEGININDLNLDYHAKVVPRMPKESFFKEGDIFINKHHRFSYMPAHTHNFIEFNYMYSGSCTQYINNEKIVLHKHDIILIDKDIIQSIDYVDENDILINILVKDDSVLELLRQHIYESSSIVTKFMLNASRMNAVHNNFILFNLKNNEVARHILETMIMKSFDSSPIKYQSIQLMMALLLSELSESIEKEAFLECEKEDTGMLPLLKYIDEHYNDLTLSSLSNVFSYNTNYLGNKLKEETGNTFKELIDKKRLDIAQEMLLATNYTTDEISQMIGFKSAPSLFRLFKKYTNLTPIAYKEKFK